MALRFPWRLFGGALRPDAISGLTPSFRSALSSMSAYAPTSVQKELGLTSAYRSKAVQQALWDRSDKTGRTVARPGHSQHNFGNAADLWGFGLGGKRYVSDQTYNWVHQNAPKFGLRFPMSYEPWHVQLASASSAAPGGGYRASLDNVRAATASYPTPDRYDPRLDSPHPGQPTGSTLPGPPAAAQVGGEAPGVPPDPLGDILGPDLKSEDRKKSLGGLMGEMMNKPPPETNWLPIPQAPSGPSLGELIQKYLAAQMGQMPPQGGQGVG